MPRRAKAVYPRGMSDQIVLAWTVNTAGTRLTPAQAAVELAAVTLYENASNDPMLGQVLGLTVASDVTAPGAGSATRTLTMNMTAVPGVPTAPSAFPCRPDTSSPPQPPYALRTAVALPGKFDVTTGSAIVPTSLTQIPSINPGDKVQFLAQEGVFYTVLSRTSSAVTLTAPYTGKTAQTGAFRLVADPAVIVAIYSTSPLDTNGVATAPAIPAGSGARTVSLSYIDSTGAPFTVVTALTGRRPAVVTLAGIDVTVITDLHIASTGAFKNSIGQITLVELSAPPAAIPPTATPADFLGPITDQAQLLITRPFVYLPPSYFALAQQGASNPALAGDFLVTTGSTDVLTKTDQTGALSPGDTMQFASQPGVTYIVGSVVPAYVRLTTPYTGLNANKIDANNDPRPTNQTAGADKQPTGAVITTPAAAAPPTSAQLAAPLAQYTNPGDAFPPADVMQPPVTVSPGPAPNFLSSLFTQTLSLALAVPVVAQPITFV